MDVQIIRGSRLKTSLLLVLCLPLVAIGVWMLGDHDIETWKAWLAIGLFGGGVVMSIFQLIRPAELRLGRESFRYSALGRSLDIRWDDVEAFHVWKNPVPTTMQRLVAWTYKEGRKPAGAAISGGLGAEGSIPGLLTIPTDKLVDLMNQRLEASRS